MRTLTITLITAFVFLLAQQLVAAADGPDRGKGGASQAVVTGSLVCVNNHGAALETFGGLGVLAIPTTNGTSLIVFSEHAEDCLDLLPALADQVPHRICEVSITTEVSPGVEAFGFVCAGRADAVISGLGKMAKALIRLRQP